jgi:hypothetical protein
MIRPAAMYNVARLLLVFALCLLPRGVNSHDPPAETTLLPVPSEEEVISARKVVRELFKSDFDKASDSRSRSDLSRRMIEVAKETKTDAAGRFALLMVAREIAILAQDPASALEAIKALEDSFKVEGVALRVETLQKIVRAPGAALAMEELVEPWRAVTRDAFRAEDPDLVKACIELGDSFRKLTIPAERKARLGEVARANEQLVQLNTMLPAKATLRSAPDDPAANLAVGEYYCLAAEVWTAGLPHLAKGNEAKLANVAKQELDEPMADAEQVKLADDWWALAEDFSPSKQAAAQRRAAFWYERALPKLSGLAEVRARRRVESMTRVVAAELGPAEKPGGAEKSGKGIVRYSPQRVTVNEPIKAGLDWLAAHQLPDGSWSFDHRGGGCGGRCRDPGRLTDCPSATTGMALLAFLYAGQTHQEGDYKKVVENGLTFLSNRAKSAKGGLNEPGATMYGHGLATLAICEALARTGDDRLRPVAQATVNFTIAAQDPSGGGWRYTPRQAGDTSVTGWQLSGLHLASGAGLKVPDRVFHGAKVFLDSVQAEGGSRYGYTGPGGGQATTAIGLLGRLQLGVPLEDPAVQRGAEFISSAGPSNSNLYFNLYATKLLRNLGGAPWETWRDDLRGVLDKARDHDGHQAGSVSIKGDHGVESGGRLYCTTISMMLYCEMQATSAD